ncbi:stage V sporulation protein B [Terribacillus saccharophilus]|uniref:Stage V sporulation protein B n=1 Tax=Terribacillus saccharophilus TaxID=361277 RepID=A0A268HG79_9BACI|nr:MULTISPECIES: stage V sporulation protein B [Terribacillus]PAD36578.1 stage V sporulation protein B [Terribacillus saccharophilus]PAD97234.1 stage V sporulation protein B [Terribacillus saccharophilus]PAE00989.1 stage V sporulation protein B [Terribacillus saccharophilus]PAE08877.1 stage V sporulation protein B [Terribacillus saccharophilus]
MTKQTFLKGALILIAASLITRFLGFVNRIVVARVMGEEGIGLYMMAMPTLFLATAITQFGLPTAISKRVAEADVRGDNDQIKKIVVVSLTVTLSISIVFVGVLYLAAPFLADKLLKDARVIYPLLAIGPVIPILAVAAVLRGYFQGKQNMKPQSFSQVIEQIVRISCTVFLVKFFLPYGVEFAALGAMISVLIGEFISLLYMFYQFKRKKTVKIRSQFVTALKGGKQTLDRLFSIALPATGSRLVASGTHFLEPILTAQSLALAGVGTAMATRQYGELTGYALPLLFLPTFITNSLATALLPSISEANEQNRHQFVHYRIHQAIRLSFASGAIATVILTVFAGPILHYMYGSESAERFILLMAPFYLMMYIQMPLSTALQALDAAKSAMWNTIIGAGVKIILLVSLASNAKFGIIGVAISMIVTVVLITLLHLISLARVAGFRLSWKELGQMLGLLGLTVFSAHLLKGIFASSLYNLPAFLLLLLILTVLYLLFMLSFGFITRAEVEQFLSRKKR